MLGAIVVATGYWFLRLNKISDTDTDKIHFEPSKEETSLPNTNQPN